MNTLGRSMALESLPSESQAFGGSSASLPQIPDHELLWEIGRGAYGSVWLARSVMGSLRAVKIVERARFQEDGPYNREFDGIRRFEPLSREHDGFIDVLHVGKDRSDRFFYYVMELGDDARDSRAAESLNALDSGVLRGFVPKTLKARLANRDAKEGNGLPEADCIAISRQLLKALIHLHEKELVHRDIKPSNIIFANGAPKLADIGLVTGTGGLGSTLGTANYLAPEGSGGAQADIFAFGMVLYEMLTGNSPGQWPSLPRGFEAASDERKDLNRICMRACAANPNERYPTAKEMLADLEAAANKRLQEAEHLVRRQRAVIAWLAVLVVATGMGTAFYFVRKQARIDHRNSILNETRVARGRLRTTGWFTNYSALLGQIPIGERDADALANASAFLSGLDASAVALFPESSRSAAFNGRGDVLFGGAEGSSAKIITAQGAVRRLPCTLEGPVAWETDEKPLQMVALSNSVSLIDPSNLKTVLTFDGGGGSKEMPIDMLCLARDAKFAAASGAGQIILWARKSPAIVASVAGSATALAFSPDNHFLAVGDGVGGVRILNIPTLSEELSIPARPPGNAILALGFGRNPKRPREALERLDGWLLAIGDRGARLEVRDLHSGDQLPLRGATYFVNTVEFSPDGCTLASAGRNQPILWDIATSQPLLNLACAGGGAATALAFDATGREIAFAAEKGHVRGQGSTAVLRLELDRGIGLMRGLDSVVQKTWCSPNDKFVAALDDKWNVGVWDLERSRLEYILAAPNGYYAENADGSFSPDSTRLAICSIDEARIYDLDSGKAIKSWALPHGFVNQIHFNSDGSLLALRKERAPEQFKWSLRLLMPDGSNRLVASQAQNGEEAEYLRISPNGRWFLAGMVQGNRRLVRAHDINGILLWETEVKPNELFRFCIDDTGSVFGYSHNDPWPRTFIRRFPGFQLIGQGHEILAIGPRGKEYVGYRVHVNYASDLSANPFPLTTDSPPTRPSQTFSKDGKRVAWGLNDGGVAVANLDKVTKALNAFTSGQK